METRIRIITKLAALYLIVMAFKSNKDGRGIHMRSYRPFKENSEEPQDPEESITSPRAFTGTILKSGIDFLFRDMSGEVYLLDAQLKADLFEGENVMITGIAESDAKILHAEAVEQLTA